MSSITAQQTKLDLELVPKENRIDIGKCNGRIPRGHTGEINLLNDVVVDQMHQPWRTFAALINRVYLERLVVLTTLVSSVLKSWGYVPLVNIDYMELLWEASSTRLKTESTKARKDVLPSNPRLNKTYFGHATDEEPVRRKRVKRSCQEKKSSNYSIAGIVFKETPVKTKSTGKEKVDVSRGKGIDLLSEVALAKKAQFKNCRKTPSVEKITPIVTSEGTGDKPGVPDATEDDSTKSESESWGNDEDDSNNEQEASDEGSGQENESEEQESDSEQDEESDDDNKEEEEVDQENDMKMMRLKTDKEVVQGEGVDAEMIDTQQGNENLETTQEQTKAAKYDLPGIEDMVPNIWSPVKVAYDRYALWVTHVKVMRKHGYGYLEEIVLRRADNTLYRFKEGDFPRLRINDIEDMLLLVGKFGKEKSHYNDQGHQQAAKGKEDDEEFGEIRWW
ncbi:hypothetical protein Tco_1509080 [Tanacetum coccineum]